MMLWMVFAVVGVSTVARGYVVDALEGSRVMRTEEPRVVVPEVYYVVVGEELAELAGPDVVLKEAGMVGGVQGEQENPVRGRGEMPVGGDTDAGGTHIYIYRYTLGSPEPVPVEGPELGDLRGCEVEKVYVGTDEVGSLEANERVMEERVKKFTTLGAQEVKRLFGVGRVAIVRCKKREEKP